ncbi:hypothetical protein EDB86DRAFT_2917885 [Lactarius hatsudake]|nr:hypothetical protein EDB86DRAFT_2917885 [Lactarius hatsudake]
MPPSFDASDRVPADDVKPGMATRIHHHNGTFSPGRFDCMMSNFSRLPHTLSASFSKFTCSRHSRSTQLSPYLSKIVKDWGYHIEVTSCIGQGQVLHPDRYGCCGTDFSSFGLAVGGTTTDCHPFVLWAFGTYDETHITNLQYLLPTRVNPRRLLSTETKKQPEHLWSPVFFARGAPDRGTTASTPSCLHPLSAILMSSSCSAPTI